MEPPSPNCETAVPNAAQYPYKGLREARPFHRLQLIATQAEESVSSLGFCIEKLNPRNLLFELTRGGAPLKMFTGSYHSLKTRVRNVKHPAKPRTFEKDPKFGDPTIITWYREETTVG
jgi:hypothetical protein